MNKKQLIVGKTPETPEEWQSFIDTCLKGGALITDIVFNMPGITQFLIGWGIEKRNSKTLMELKDISLELQEEIKKKVNLNYIKSDEFLVFISNAMQEALALKNIEKIKYFRSAIINGMIKNAIEEGKKLLFIDALSTLSIDSLLLLKTIHDNSAKEIDARLTFRYIQQRASYDNSDYLMANLRALEKYNLVELEIPGVKDNDYANYPVSYNKFGKDFISFIMDY